MDTIDAILQQARRTVDRRIDLAVPRGVAEALRGTVEQVDVSTRTALTRLDGQSAPVPVPYLSMPTPLVAGDHVRVERRFRDGSLLITGLYGRDRRADQTLRWVDLRDFGSRGDGANDETGEMRRALDEIEAAGSGVLWLPGTAYVTSQRLDVTGSGIAIAGQGAGPFANGQHPGPGTTWTWAGAAGETMLRFAPREGTAYYKPSDNGVSGIVFRGQGVAGRAVSVLSQQLGDFSVTGSHFTGAVLHAGCASTTLGEGKDTMWNRFWVEGVQSAAADGSIMLVDGITAADVDGAVKNPCFNEFWVYGQHYLADGVDLGSSDNNVFHRVAVGCQAGYPGNSTSGGYGIRLRSSVDAGSTARVNTFSIVSAPRWPAAVAGGGVYAEGTEVHTYPSKNNIIWQYDKENSSPDPIIGTGASLYWRSDHVDPFGVGVGAVTLAEMADLATDRLIGRATAGPGVPEAIALTAAGRALIDDASATAQRTTLGVGTGDAPAFTGVAVNSVAFPATQVASSGANVLDDYEEGTWTPALTFATPGNLAVTYPYQTGRYTKVGRNVMVEAVITTSAFTYTTAASHFQITGLPFTPGVAFGGAGPCGMRGYTKANFTQLTLENGNGAALFYVYASGSGQVGTELTTADVPSGGTLFLFISAHYSV